MIALINRIRIKNWEYAPHRLSGTYLGFHWMFVDDFGSYYKFKVWNEFGETFLIPDVNSNKTVKGIIEDSIQKYYKELLVDCITSTQAHIKIRRQKS